MSRLFQIIIILSVLSSEAWALNIGDTAPNFSLPSSEGKTVSLADFQGRIVVLEWFNRGCPFVQKHYESGGMQALQNKAKDKSVIWLTINSTNSEHRDFIGVDGSQKVAKEWGIKSAAMLTDEDGKTGTAYAAKTTPQMFVINREGKLAYQGAIDDDPSPSGDSSNAYNYVDAAIEELLSNQPVSKSETRPYGCSVKY